MKLPRRNEKKNPFRYSLLSRIFFLPFVVLGGTIVYACSMGILQDPMYIAESLYATLMFTLPLIVLIVMQYFIKVTRGTCGVRIVGVFVTTFVPWDEIVGCYNGLMVSLVDTAGKKHRMWAVQQANALDPETSLPGRFERQLEIERLEFAKQREDDQTVTCVGQDRITKHPTWINLVVAVVVIALTFYSCWFYGTLPWQF